MRTSDFASRSDITSRQRLRLAIATPHSPGDFFSTTSASRHAGLTITPARHILPARMAVLPTGTVTFLLTDLEGSTLVWDQHPAQMRTALARHDAIIESLAQRHRGTVVRPRGEGDSRFCVFARASDALAAAAAVQHALHRELWPTPQALRVRIALHTGEVSLRDGDYYGSAVNRCARIRALAHGGQILISDVTSELVRESLGDGLRLRDLGVQRLRDLTAPERIFQVDVPGVPCEFPPLLSLDALPNNLRAQATALIGREAQIGAARTCLLREDVRLVTLTGPGGIGKTRLGLQIAAEVIELFPDGVFFVPLAPIADPNLVAATTAQVLGLRESEGRSLREVMRGYLRDRHMLLIFDNFEQVIAAAPDVAELLAACPRLKALVTSRAPLRVYGEHEVAIPPMAMPEARTQQPLEELAGYEAIRLLTERANAVRADFALNQDNTQTIVEICQHLDGLPLAIELAAARFKYLSPQTILDRLADRFALLTGGARDLPPRQRTLRDTIAWSHDLLTEREQVLFRSLGVFRGGWTLEAAEAVCAQVGDVLDGLGSLVDKNLVRQISGERGQPRFTMLETVLEYARGQLAASGKDEPLRGQHAAYYLELAERGEPALRSHEQPLWLDRLEAEIDNLRAALEWLTGKNDFEAALRQSAALAWFWGIHGYWTEGRAWSVRVIDATAGGALERTRVRMAATPGRGLVGARSGRRRHRATAARREPVDRSRAGGQARAGLGVAPPRTSQVFRR